MMGLTNLQRWDSGCSFMAASVRWAQELAAAQVAGAWVGVVAAAAALHLRQQLAHSAPTRCCRSSCSCSPGLPPSASTCLTPSSQSPRWQWSACASSWRATVAPTSPVRRCFSIPAVCLQLQPCHLLLPGLPRRPVGLLWATCRGQALPQPLCCGRVHVCHACQLRHHAQLLTPSAC